MYATNTNAAHPDRVKKWMTCLGCGKRMWTDRCHRLCKKCSRRNDATPSRRAFRASLPHGVAEDDQEPRYRSN